MATVFQRGARGGFKSKVDAFQSAKSVYWCLPCHQPAEKQRCDNCGSKPHYFPSRGEHRRYSALWMQQHMGALAKLRVQVPFPIKINGIDVCKYVCDFAYEQDGRQVYEEFKGSAAHQDSASALRRRLAEVVYGINVKVVEARSK